VSFSDFLRDVLQIKKMVKRKTELSSVPVHQNRRMYMETIIIFMLIALILGLLVGVSLARPSRMG
jgi:hypothetical protein